MMRRHITPLIALLVSACASVPPGPPPPETPAQGAQRRAEAPRPQYNLAGYPPATREGYIDGCETARQSSYGRKDDKRIAADPQYKMGWNDGFAICGKK
jgi:hypothetical protein